MTRLHPSATQALTLLLATAVALSATVGFVGLAGAATTTDLTVSITDDDDTLETGETTTVEIAVASADGGVGAAELGVELSDSGVATITDVSVLNNPGNTDNDVGGQSADVKYAFADSADTGAVTMVEVTLQATAPGSTDVNVVQNSQTGNLVVFDENGAGYTLDTVGSATLTVNALPANGPPVADAGADQTVDAGAIVALDASGSSDPDGDTLSYQWTQTGGPSVTLSDATAAAPTFTAPSVTTTETLNFEVSAADDNGGTDTDTVSVTVEPSAAGDLSSSVSLVPATNAVSVGGTVTYDLVVENADGGVGAYSAMVTLDGPVTAAITDVELFGNPAGQTQTVDIASDGSSVSIDAALMDTQDSGSVTVATITVDGTSPGTATLTPTVDALGNEQGDSYAVTGTNDASVTVTESATTVNLSPASEEVAVGDTTSFDLVVDDANGGVGAYSATVTLEDPSVATITDVQLLGDPAQQTSSVDIAPDGSSVSIDAALMNTDDTGSVPVAVISVSGDDSGSTDLSPTVPALGDESGTNYAVTGTNGASLTVTEISVGGFPPASDPDDDGKYEDVNGDDTINIVDVQAMFANLDSQTLQEDPDQFDFNDDGSVDVVDVQALFTEVTD